MANERRNRFLGVVLVVLSCSGIGAYSLTQPLSSVAGAIVTPGYFYCQDLSTGTTGVGTTIGNAYGTLDPKWQFISGPTPAVGSTHSGGSPPFAYSVDAGNIHIAGAWYNTGIGPTKLATWISTGGKAPNLASLGRPPDLENGYLATPYIYKTSPGYFSGPGKLVLVLVAADDMVKLTLDASSTSLGGIPYNPPLSMANVNGMFYPSNPLVINVGSGTHTLTANVYNTGSSGYQPSGLLVIAKSCASPTVWTYTAKFICNIGLPPRGFIQRWPTPSDAETIGLVPGEYKSDINVHNHNSTNTVQITKKFVASVAEPLKNGSYVGVSNVAYLSTNLGPDGAFRIDCAEIMSLLSPNATVFTMKGWVVLTTNTTINQPPPLDVWAEYTVESFNHNNLPINDPSQVSTGVSIDVEQVTPAASQ